ncbi:MAG: hypothetical protein A2033_16120 [Bacteroidetes bacterium GWA2_31_9]|nr:MAG: hypothetical protein A2033_16120 [Bacteroidetes bacterium GWA2_31_9]
MIVEFSVKNFRSIKELQTISFVATGLKSPAEFSDIDKNNIAEEGDMRLLKTVGLYGANASGKSNIVRALEYFIQIIKKEPSSESNLSLLCDPFLYQENSNDTESYFQIVLIIENKKYRYGFTVKRNSNYNDSLVTDISKKESKEIITNEWLFGTKEKNSGEFFIRKNNHVDKDKLPNQNVIPALPYDHTLFLTHAVAHDNQGVCAIVRNYFYGAGSNYLEGTERFRKNTIFLLQNEEDKKNLLELLSSFNLIYDDITFEKDTSKPNELTIPPDKIFLYKKFQTKNNIPIQIKLNLNYHESAGTKKLFDLAGFLLRVFSVPISLFIILDELDSNFHPSLIIKLIGLFNNPLINKNKSQLLFTSHDTNLMSPSIMRRDQFYFTEKNEDDSTKLYSLADLKGIRNDADFAKQYLAGFYGALPIITDYINENISPNE